MTIKRFTKHLLKVKIVTIVTNQDWKHPVHNENQEGRLENI